MSAANDAIRLMALETVLERTNMYLGTYTFLMRGALSIIAVISIVVAAEKKLKTTWPARRYNG